MGITREVETRREQRDLILDFDSNTGKLSIEAKHADFQDTSVVFSVNGSDEEFDELIALDMDGKGMIQFDKQSKIVQYNVKVKARGALTDDQRLVFWY